MGAESDEGGIITPPDLSSVGKVRTPPPEMTEPGDPQPDFSSLDEKYGGGADDHGAPPAPADRSPDAARKRAEAEADRKLDDANKGKKGPLKSGDDKDAAAAFERNEREKKEKAAADLKKAEEDKKKTPEKPDKKKTATEEEEPDEEVDKIQIKANAPEEIKKQFAALRKITKAAKKNVKTLTGEIEGLKNQLAANPGLTEDDKKRLDRMGQLEEFEQTWLIEQSPAFREKWDPPIEKAEARLKDFLVKMNMPEALVPQALANVEGWNRWPEAEKLLGAIDQRLLQNLRNGVIDAKLSREQAMEELHSNRTESVKKHNEQMVASEQAFWRDAAQVAKEKMKTATNVPSAKEIKEDAPEGVKTALQKHNDLVTERSKEIATLTQNSIIKRDPEAAAELSMRAYKATWLEEQITELEAEKAEMQARIDELEGIVGDARRPASQRQTTTTPPKRDGAPDALSEKTPEEAADDYFLRGKR